MNTDFMITRNEALCFIYILDFTPSNIRVCKEALEDANMEICFTTDPRFPVLLPKTTYQKAEQAGLVKGYPEEVNMVF